MFWIWVPTLLAGGIIGFTTGITDEPAAGHISSAVTGFAAGILGTSIAGGTLAAGFLEHIGQFFTGYLVVLFVFYITGNILRRNGCVDWIVGDPRKRFDWLEWWRFAALPELIGGKMHPRGRSVPLAFAS